MPGYTVRLDGFHGPLDLLLYLVRRDEVDIRGVSLAGLADGFLAFLVDARSLDIELAGEFVVVAATLLEIKARSLLPDAPAAVAGQQRSADPRRELVRQLLEYRQFKDAAAALEDRADRHATRVPRVQPPPDPSAERDPVPVRPVEVWDLVSTFARLMREVAPLAVVQVDDTPQHVHEHRVRAAVAAAGRASLRDLFTPPHTRARLIGLFLAVLELVKTGAVRLEQADAFGELWLAAVDVPASGGR